MLYQSRDYENHGQAVRRSHLQPVVSDRTRRINVATILLGAVMGIIFGFALGGWALGL